MRTLNQAELYPTSRPMLWLPLSALAVMYGLFTFGWMVYRVHLPTQMAQFGFSEQAIPLLLLVESLLAIAVEPLAGLFSDRTNRSRGTRFPIIGLGAALAALLFVGLAALVAFAEPTAPMQPVLISLLLGWSIAMSFFRSPALALLKRYAPTVRLPQAASLLTVAAGLAGAATPLASQFVLAIGVTVSFTTVAILILLSAIWLRWTNPITRVASEPAELFNGSEQVSIANLLNLFGLGLASTLAFRLAIETFPKLLKANIPGINPSLFVGLVFLTVAIAAFPVGRLALRQGNSHAMIIGAGIAALSLGLTTYSRNVPIAVIVAVGLGVGFSLILNGTLPFALEQVPAGQAGLGIGIFFAGVAAASSVMVSSLSRPGVLSPPLAILLGIVALIGVAICVRRSP